MVIVGTGIAPATKFLEREETGIKLDAQGAVICDPFLQSTAPDIYAAGDVCSFPYWQTGKQTRVEHWINALDQGSYAAFNMMGKFVPYGNIPFFWTRHYNKSLQYVGHCTSYDNVHIDGDVMAGKFIAYYIKDNKIQAVSGQGRSADLLTMFELFNQSKMPPASEIIEGYETPQTLRRKLKQTPGLGCRREGCC
jgi:NADPH-dependent 2,4-dienoyl-CoA reductase/sulfur reductase-like enzyme